MLNVWAFWRSCLHAYKHRSKTVYNNNNNDDVKWMAAAALPLSALFVIGCCLNGIRTNNVHHPMTCNMDWSGTRAHNHFLMRIMGYLRTWWHMMRTKQNEKKKKKNNKTMRRDKKRQRKETSKYTSSSSFQFPNQYFCAFILFVRFDSKVPTFVVCNENVYISQSGAILLLLQYINDTIRRRQRRRQQ